jgi:hypothetical protein
MGKYVYYLVIAGIVLFMGMTMFPTIKDMFGFNDTTGFGYVLASMYTGLPYAAAFFIFYAAFKASRGDK